MSEARAFRDPIHKFVELNEEEVALVDAPVFQRLRRLRQLALAHLAYPSAVHTRFEHSIGVCHVARLMSEKLHLDEGQRKLIRLAALVHDLGHGPFSHVSEEALEIYADPAKFPGKADKIHEAITAKLIQEDKDLCAHISSSDRDKIVRVLSVGHGEPIVKAILSGPLDADKQDYLSEIAIFAGCSMGCSIWQDCTMFSSASRMKLAINSPSGRMECIRWSNLFWPSTTKQRRSSGTEFD